MIEIFASAVLTFAISKIIDALYKKFFAEIAFPAEIESRGRFRKIILFAGILSAEIFLQNLFSITATIFLLIVTVTDFEQQIIFDKILLPFAILGIFFTVSLNLSLENHLLAAILGGGFFLLLAFVGGIGGGDIKFIACLGLWFGTAKLFYIVVYGMIFAGVAALFYLLFTKSKTFAYAPYFALSTLYLAVI